MLTDRLQDTLRELGLNVPPSRRLILMVDDERDNLDVTSMLLEGAGELHTATSGAEALSRIDEVGPPDVIIADQRMPGMTGVELLETIARKHPETVRIVLTAYSDLEPMIDAVNRGAAYRFMLKPADPTELRAAIEDAIGIKTAARALRELVGALGERRERLAQTLTDLRARQEQAIAAEQLTTVGRMTSGIVHDLRNAASILQILVDLLRQQVADEAINATATTAWNSLGALLELLEQIRDFAQSKSTATQRETSDVYSVIATALRLFHLEPVAARREITVTVADETRQLAIDRTRVRQGLMALLRNACRASAEGSTVRVVVHPGPTPASACIKVQDDGVGMDPATLARAREPFFSAFDPPGSGLGLEIARLAASAHDGDLSLESSVGRGTTACLVFHDVIATETTTSPRSLVESSGTAG